MYLGKMVEFGDTEDLFKKPLHPYTEALLSAIPVPSLHNRRKRIVIKGEITSPIEPPNACRFAKRCSRCCETCNECGNPPLVEVSPGHFVACHLVK